MIYLGLGYCTIALLWLGVTHERVGTKRANGEVFKASDLYWGAALMPFILVFVMVVIFYKSVALTINGLFRRGEE